LSDISNKYGISVAFIEFDIIPYF